MKSIDVLGVHYSATIYRWYKNWLANEDNVVEKYGRKYVVSISRRLSSNDLIVCRDTSQVVSCLALLPCVVCYCCTV